MKLVYFAHSLRSCWNHGNAHFIRGILREWLRRCGEAVAVESANRWSADNLRADAGEAGLAIWARAYPELVPCVETDTERALDGADVVLVHEWNEPALVQALGRRRRAGGRFLLFFHDTHHRAVSDPEAIKRFDLSGYDGVLAFGQALAEVYRRWGWGGRAHIWHEAADTALFRPPAGGERAGLVWIGNWGDGERSAEIEEFLLAPAKRAGWPLAVHGVRYPPEARALLAQYGAEYRGWVANPEVPRVFAHHLATMHVPRRPYATALPGIPTIRVFEALACGIPLLSAPWEDAEGLFRPGIDYLVAPDGAAAERHLRALANDPALREALVARGLETVRARHSCAHRVQELLSIVSALRQDRAA